MEGTALTESAAAEEIREFTIDGPEEELEDLRRRIKATRWPDREVDPSQGVQLETIQALADYWATDYDWRSFEERFAALPQFVTEIDGVDIHFIHVRSEHEDALPMIVTHGWPGSIDRAAQDHRAAHQPDGARRERGGRVPPGDPVAAGPRLLGQADRARLGPDPHRDGLGRARWSGSATTATSPRVATGATPSPSSWRCLKPAGLLGIHTNMPATLPPEISAGLQSGGPAPERLSADEQQA